MPLYTRFRLGKNLSVRPTSRGLRFSVGPRAARVHLGAGRPAVSTGTGPFTYYQPLDGGRTPAGSATRGLASAAKADRAREIADALLSVTNLHHAEFPQRTAPSAPMPAAVDVAEVRQRHADQATAGISVWRRARRKAATQAGEAAAAAEIAVLQAEAEQHARQQHEHLERRWQALLGNDPATVLTALQGAFGDNDSPVEVSVDGATADLSVLVPGPGILPERMPSRTAAGNISLKQMTKTQSADFYRMLVAGTVLVTAKEAFATAPGIGTVRVSAVRDGEPDVYGRSTPELLMECTLDRAALRGVRWTEHDSLQILTTVAEPLRFRVAGRVRDLVPLTREDRAAV